MCSGGTEKQSEPKCGPDLPRRPYRECFGMDTEAIVRKGEREPAPKPGQSIRERCVRGE